MHFLCSTLVTPRNGKFLKKDYEIQVEYVDHNKTYVTVFRNIETYIIKLMILKVHFNTKMNQNSGYYMINICLK